MEDLMRQARALARGMWQYRWPAVAVAWIVALIGAIVVFKVPDRYEASARIFVDTQSILKPLMSGLTVQPNVDQQVVMLSRTLISRPNVEKLVRMADLDLKSDSKLQREQLIEQLMRDLQIRSSAARDNLYMLAYQDSNPAKANRVIQSLVSIFVESGLGDSRKDTESAKAFLDEQIRGYRLKLEEAEARVKDFRLRNIEISTADGKDSATRLGDISTKLEQARLELREAENARDAARRQFDAEKGAKGNLTTQSLLQESALTIATPEIDARIDAQKRNLDALLQRFTDQHPDVANARRLIAELEAEKRKEVEALRKSAAATPAGGVGTGSLAAQEMGRLVATAEVQVASLRTRVGEYTARYGQAREALKTAPQLEAAAAQLSRDYAIHKKNYEDLVARREAAIMSGDMEDRSGLADFRLIDPPRVSAQPVWPNRFLLLPLALLAGLAAGLLTAFAASQLRPVFHDADALRTKTELPLLGVVSRIRTSVDERAARTNLLRFATASGSLVGMFALGLIVMAFMATR